MSTAYYKTDLYQRKLEEVSKLYAYSDILFPATDYLYVGLEYYLLGMLFGYKEIIHN